MKTYRRCILILADGSRPDVFEDLCDRGELPVCDRLFRKTGRFAPAVSVFPSTTGPAYLPFLTGNYPGTCNLPGIRWFDKKAYGEGKPLLKRFRSYVGFESFLMNQDIRLATPTLFQLFDRPVNIFSAINRGSSFHTNKTKHSRIWYWYYAHLTDHWSFVDRAAVRKLQQALDDDFDFAFVVFPGVDEYSHLSHPHHEKTFAAYRTIDQGLGEIWKTLEKKGWQDDTLILLVSDHGLSSTHEHFGMGSFLEERGIKTFYYPKIFKWNFEAASMVSGNGMLHLYFKEGEGKTLKELWKGRAPFEILEKERGELLRELLSQEAVDLLAGQSADGSVVVLSRRGKARIREVGNRIQYQTEGEDPFGYPSLPVEMENRASLEKTFLTEYPDALAQLLQIFRSSRTGDWVISAKKGYDLRRRFEHPEHHSSHGTLIKEHMLIPFYSNAPLPKGPARSCDVFPTLLKLMDKDIPQGIDGISLI